MTKRNQTDPIKLVKDLKSAATHYTSITEKQKLENLNKLIAENPLLIPVMKVQFKPYYQELLNLALKINSLQLVKNLQEAQESKSKKIKLLSAEKKDIEAIFQQNSRLNQPKVTSTSQQSMVTRPKLDKIRAIGDSIINSDIKALETLLTGLDQDQIEAYLPGQNNTLLHFAVVSDCDGRIFDRLVNVFSQDARSRRDQHGDTALHIVAENGQLERVRILIAALTESQINQVNNKGFTALMLAAQKGKDEVIRAIVDKTGKKSLAKTGPFGVPLLHLAAINGHLPAIRALVEMYNDDQLIGEFKCINFVEAMIERGHFEATIFMVRRFAEKNLLTDEKQLGKRAIGAAVFFNRVDILKVLIEIIGKEHCQFIHNDLSTLEFVVEKGFVEIFKLLIKTFPLLLRQVPESEGTSLLCMATEHKQLEIVQFLVGIMGKTAIIEKVGYNWHTALLEATSVGSLDIIKFFISQLETDRNQLKELLCTGTLLGYTCMEYAIRRTDTQIAKFLVKKFQEHRFSLNILTKLGNTPLHTAISCGNLDMVKILIENLDSNEINTKHKVHTHIKDLHLHVEHLQKKLKSEAVKHKNPVFRNLIKNLGLATAKAVNTGDSLEFIKLAKAYFKYHSQNSSNEDLKERQHRLDDFIQHKETIAELKTLSKESSDMELSGSYFEIPNPLQVSVLWNQLEITRFLLASRKVNVDATFQGATCLHFAVLSQNKELVELLLQYNANVSIKEEDSEMNALQMAEKSLRPGHKIIQYLRKRTKKQEDVNHEEPEKPALQMTENLSEQKKPLSSEIKEGDPLPFVYKFLAGWNSFAEFTKNCRAANSAHDLSLAENQKEKSRRYQSKIPSDEKASSNPQSFYLLKSTKKELEEKHYFLLGASTLEQSQLPTYIRVTDEVVDQAIAHGVWDYNKAQLQKGVQFVPSKNSDHIGIKKLADGVYELANKAKGVVGDSRLYTTEPMVEREIRIQSKKIKALVLTLNRFAKDHDELQRNLTKPSFGSV
jgi:ankyrin repeat protein